MHTGGFPATCPPPGSPDVGEAVTDVVVVGSGSAALTAALAARESGCEVVVLESTDLVGGSSAMSGGGLWVPDNPLMREAGVPDSLAAARAYLDDVVGDAGPASSPERRDAFLAEGPRMVAWLRDLGFRFVYGRGMPDYHADRPGASAVGREVAGARWNSRPLGPWANRIRGVFPLPVHTAEVRQMAVSLRTVRGFLTAANVVGIQVVASRLVGRRPFGAGNSLVGQLLHLLLRRGVPVWLESPMTELWTGPDGGVVGVVARRRGATVLLRARRGVVLAAGGFARNEAMRQVYLPHPTSARWSLAAPGDLGDAIRAGQAVGAALALMDEAWWGPTMIDHTGKPGFVLWERSMPFGFIVDSTGRRFCNEAGLHNDVGRRQNDRHRTAPAVPAHLVFDSRHRAYYPFGFGLPRITPRRWLTSGFMTKAPTLAELAARTGIDPDGLHATATRFAHFAATGRDEDFGRGDSAYDRDAYSDPRVRPNPNLGAVSRPPFYAVEVWPGDVGTKGGLLTDARARVLREDGSVIGGLYAAGNTAASVMGSTFPAPGATIGAAMTFGYLAGRDAARRSGPVGT